MRILVIDDDPVMRELLDALLQLAGHQVEIHANSSSALERLHDGGSDPIDVVLTDLHMPGLQGRELVASLLERRQPNTVVVGMSGSFPTEQETELLEVFLQKPFGTEQFEEAVTHARERQRLMAAPTLQIAPESLAATDALDGEIYARLAGALPSGQLRALYELTLADVATREKRMREAIETGDYDTVRTEAHAIKGGTGMVGAIELHRLASALESGTENDTSGPDNFAKARARLQRMLNERLPLHPD